MSCGKGARHIRNLTLPSNVDIIPPLFNAEVQEIQLARKVIWLQVWVTIAASGTAYGLGLSHEYAIPVIMGGGVSIVNGALLAWRMARSTLLSNNDAHQQLRLLYFFAAERYLLVFVMLGICLALLKLLPTVVLGGFVLGQAALVAGRLFLKIKTEDSD